MYTQYTHRYYWIISNIDRHVLCTSTIYSSSLHITAVEMLFSQNWVCHVQINNQWRRHAELTWTSEQTRERGSCVGLLKNRSIARTLSAVLCVFVKVGVKNSIPVRNRMLYCVTMATETRDRSAYVKWDGTIVWAITKKSHASGSCALYQTLDDYLVRRRSVKRMFVWVSRAGVLPRVLAYITV